MRSPEIFSITFITAYFWVKDEKICSLTEKTQREINQSFPPDQHNKNALTLNMPNETEHAH